MATKKMFGIMARRPDLTRQEFQDHYRHPHGTMGMLITTLRSYVQSHQIDTDKLDESQFKYEAIAELTFENADDLLGMREEHVMSQFHNFDEPKFLDMQKTRLFIGEEDVQTSTPSIGPATERPEIAWRLDNRPTSIKLLQFFRAEAAAEVDRSDHVELGRQLNAYRHVICRPTYPSTFVKSRKDKAPDFVGVREMWWPTLTVFNQSVEAAAAAWQELTNHNPDHVHSLLARAERYR